MADEARILQLMLNRLQGPLSAAENEELDTWLNAGPGRRLYMERRVTLEAIAEDLKILAEMNERSLDEKVWAAINAAEAKHQATYTNHRLRRRLRNAGIALAASLVVAVIVSKLHSYFSRSASPAEFSANRVAIWDGVPSLIHQEIKGSMLVVSGNSNVILDEVPEGRLEWQGEQLIVKRSSRYIAFISYASMKSMAKLRVRDDADSAYDDISVPTESAPWDISLPDGSSVTLFPGSFLRIKIYLHHVHPPQRLAALVGKAMFKVSHDKVPFVVETSQLEMIAKGTGFLVTDFGDKNVFSVLQYSGTLDLTDGHGHKRLDSAQSATRDPKHDGIRIDSGVSLTPQNIARRETFDFSHHNLKSALKELGRWYGIKNIYVDQSLDTVTPGKLSLGHIPKDLPLPQLLEQLEKQSNDLHFSADADIISVTKQTSSGQDQTK